MIDCAYIIALKETIDNHHDELVEKFKTLQINCSKIIIFEAVDGRNPVVDFKYDLFDWKLEDCPNDWHNRDLLSGEIGCALSHLKVWKHAQSEKYKKILILEEDFFKIKDIPQEAFEELDNLNWHLCYLGRNEVKPNKASVTANIVVPDYSYCTHAYLLSEAGIKNFINHQFENKIMPVDEFISATFCDHPREDLNFIWKDTKAFAFSTDYIGQLSTPETSKVGHGSIDSLIGLRDFENFDKWTSKYISKSSIIKNYDLIIDEPIDAVIKFPLFNSLFCSELIKEAEKHNKWTRDRHDFYPTCDMLLEDFAMNDVFNAVFKEFVFPCVAHHFKLDGDRWLNMRLENFIVKYSADDQPFLSLHHDQSVLSSILTLNEDYEGGGTYFHRQKKLLKGRTGELSVHPGMVSHKHGARPVSKGTRYIVASFFNID